MLEKITLEVTDTALLSQYEAVFLLHRGEFLMQMGLDDEAEGDFGGFYRRGQDLCHGFCC